MRELLSGAAAALSLVAAIHFARFYLRSKDRFFLLFGASFVLLGLHNAALGLTDVSGDASVVLYAVRLAAFGTIVVAIWLKNRE